MSAAAADIPTATRTSRENAWRSDGSTPGASFSAPKGSLFSPPTRLPLEGLAEAEHVERQLPGEQPGHDACFALLAADRPTERFLGPFPRYDDDPVLVPEDHVPGP